MANSLRVPTLQLFELNPTFAPLQPPNRPYKCNHCSKAFSSTQALGGHQNAHRDERVKGKKTQKISSTNEIRVKHQPQAPSASPFERRIALDDELFRKPKKMKGSSSRVEVTARDNLTYWSGSSSCVCAEKVASSWPVFVARSRISKRPDTAVVIDSSLPQVQLLNKEKEAKKIQELDLSLKL